MAIRKRIKGSPVKEVTHKTVDTYVRAFPKEGTLIPYLELLRKYVYPYQASGLAFRDTRIVPFPAYTQSCENGETRVRIVGIMFQQHGVPSQVAKRVTIKGDRKSWHKDLRSFTERCRG